MGFLYAFKQFGVVLGVFVGKCFIRVAVASMPASVLNPKRAAFTFVRLIYELGTCQKQAIKII